MSLQISYNMILSEKCKKEKRCVLDTYSVFASIYDIFMTPPYDKWVNNLEVIWNESKPKSILELGCGTGNITTRLAARGYDMIGVDSSPEMLSVASEKNLSGEILYLNQDMREFELYGTVDAVVSLCDCMNYILEEEELLEVFGLVHNYLNPDGWFIFDMNTSYKYENILSENTYAETTEDAAYIWQNYYDSEEEINQYEVSFFIKQDNGLYEKHEEVHFQRAYAEQKIFELLEQSKFEVKSVLDCESLEKPDQFGERVYYVARVIK